MPKNKAFSIQRGFYSMASTDGETAEITLYGEIVETVPRDWWTDEEIPGSYIAQDEFLEDLKAVEGCGKITIRMNSFGGDAGVSILIHNRLREMAGAGAELTCIVDGVAMSGGSLIMCACDHVKVNPSSLVMIHKCWSYIWGGYNADELRNLATQSDAYDKAQISIYARKTKLSDTVLSHMMGDTTYMTGREAVDKGFADELLDDAEPIDISASADGKSIFVRGRKMHLAPGMFAPDNIPTVSAGNKNPEDINPNQPEGNPGGILTEREISMNLEELRAQYPELVAQAENEARAAGQNEVQAAVAAAVQAERERLQGIDAIANLYDDDLVNEARFGATACDARELAYRGAMKASKNGSAFLTNLEKQAKTSGAKGVAASSAPDETEKKDAQEGQAWAASLIAKTLGGAGKE